MYMYAALDYLYILCVCVWPQNVVFLFMVYSGLGAWGLGCMGMLGLQKSAAALIEC